MKLESNNPNLIIKTSNVDILKENSSIYIGIGLCNRISLSKGIPFDVLSFILFSEQVRRQYNCEKVYCLIADHHAILNGFDSIKVNQLTCQWVCFLQNIIKQWNLTNHVIHISSEEPFLVKSYENADNYLQAELLDMRHYQEHYNVSIKLGWLHTLQKKSSKNNNDERYFDGEALKESENISFIYTSSGRTLNHRYVSSSPYLCIEPKNRLMFGDVNFEKTLAIIDSQETLSQIHYYDYLKKFLLSYRKLIRKTTYSFKTGLQRIHDEVT